MINVKLSAHQKLGVGERPLITFQRNYNQLLAVMFPLCLNADLLEGL